MPASYQWSICSRTNSDGDSVLERDEKFVIWANISDVANPSTGIPVRDDFTIEIKPNLGASLGVSRSAPAAIDPMNVLY